MKLRFVRRNSHPAPISSQAGLLALFSWADLSKIGIGSRPCELLATLLPLYSSAFLPISCFRTVDVFDYSELAGLARLRVKNSGHDLHQHSFRRHPS